MKKSYKIFHVIFIVLCILVLAPLFHDGVWAFLDVDVWGRLLFGTQDFITTPFQIISRGSSYFGEPVLNYSAALFGHSIIAYGFLNIFGLNIGQIVYYFVSFLISYILGYKIVSLLDLYFKKDENFILKGIIAIFTTFNPITLWLMWNTMYIYTYIAFLGIFYAIFNIFLLKRNNTKYYLVLLASLYFIVAYPRLGFPLLLLEGILFICNGILRKPRFIIGFFGLILVSPLLYIGFFDQFASGMQYIESTKNSQSDWYRTMYGYFDGGNGIRSLAVFPPDQLKMLYTGEKDIGNIFGALTVLLLIIFLIKKRRLAKLDYAFLVLVFLIILQQNLIPLLGLSMSNFTTILQSKLSFLFFDPSAYRFVLILPLIYFIYSIFSDGENNGKKVVTMASIVLVILSITIYPLYFYPLQSKQENISLKNFNSDFQVFVSQSKEGSLFPQNDGNLYFRGMPYPYNPYFFGGYKNLFTKNSRIVSPKQQELFIRLGDFKNINNGLELFNLKNIFVFKNLQNAVPGQFDFFPVRDYVGESKRLYQELLSNTGLYIRQDNENFAQFGLQGDYRYEYFLYAPRRIDRRDMASFFSGELDIFDKPIIIDPDSFHKPSMIDSYEIPVENQNIAIRYKQSVLEPTKIYAKIANFDSSKPFILQLNQTFGMSWKVKWISKDEFEEKPCIDEYKEYSITQNKVCQYKSTILDLSDTKYLDNPSVSDGHHFEGNFVGNAWFITPDNIPENMRGQGELYAVIIYEKQIWYTIALIISGFTFFTLLLLTIIQESREFLKRRKHLE